MQFKTLNIDYDLWIPTNNSWLKFSSSSSLYNLTPDQIQNKASNSSIIEGIPVAIGACLPNHCLALAAFIRSIIPAFSRHIATQ